MGKQGLISVDTGSGLGLGLGLGSKGRLYHKHIAKVLSYWTLWMLQVMQLSPVILRVQSCCDEMGLQ